MNIWIDIDNAPHVLVLNPIIRELQARGHNVEITARDFGQTLPLLELHKLPYRAVGQHAGKNKLKKGLSLILRSTQLWRFAKGQQFDLALCHGARGIVLPSRLLNIPLVVLMDYEHTFNYPFRRWARRILMPEVIPDSELKHLGFDLSRVIKYPGLKEELYVYDFEPDPLVLKEIGVNPDKVIVVMRPPATMAHYHAKESERLFWSVLRFLTEQAHTHVVLLPRTEAQATEILACLHAHENVVIPKKAVYGPNLLWHADLVISGGGTMNREAACLGVPVYSVFRGPLGGVDRYLIQQGLLRALQGEEDIKSIGLEKRPKEPLQKNKRRSQELARLVVEKILEVVQEK
jgi:predicted glycosyltransferase